MRDRRGERLWRLRRHCAAADSTRTDDHGQLSLTVVEAVVVALFVLAVATGFALAPPAPAAESDALARQTTDIASLVGSVPIEGLGILPGMACESPTEPDDRAARFYEVAAAGFPNSTFVSFRTKVRSVGRPPPETARMGTVAAMAPRCIVTLEMRYP